MKSFLELINGVGGSSRCFQVKPKQGISLIEVLKSSSSILHIQTGKEVESIHQATVISTDPKPGKSWTLPDTAH